MLFFSEVVKPFFPNLEFFFVSFISYYLKADVSVNTLVYSMMV